MKAEEMQAARVSKGNGFTETSAPVRARKNDPAERIFEKRTGLKETGAVSGKFRPVRVSTTRPPIRDEF
jgi:hypothetical protein